MPRAILLLVTFASALAMGMLADHQPGPGAELTVREESSHREEIDLASTTLEQAKGGGEDRSVAAPERAFVQPIAGDSTTTPLTVRLVAKETGIPLVGYRAYALPSGTVSAPPAPSARDGFTDATGLATLHPETAGVHLDLYATPASTPEVRPFTGYPNRLASLSPAEAVDGSLRVIEVPAGPCVVYRGPLPEGIDVRDLRVEVRSRCMHTGHRLEIHGGTGCAALDAEGFATTHVSRVRPGIQMGSFDIRIWTRDGQWGHRSVHEGHLSNQSRVFVDDALVQRAFVEIEIDGIGAPLSERDVLRLASSMRWSIIGGDPDRAPMEAGDGPMNHVLRPFPELVGPGRLRLGDLPIGATIEFESTKLAYDVVKRFEVLEHPRRVVSSRGEPDRATLRVRRR